MDNKKQWVCPEVINEEVFQTADAKSPNSTETITFSS